MTLVTAVPSAPPALDAVDVTAPSGLRIIAAARTGAPIVEVRLVVPFGLDDPATAAAGELLGATLFGGAAGRNRAALDRDLARLGAAWSAAVHPEQLTITAYALADRLTDLLDLLVSALSTATYPDADVAGQRARLAHRIAAHAAQPHVQARDALLTRCFGDHPAAREHPDPVAVRTVDATVLRALHRERLVPSGSTLVLAGDLDPDVAAGLAIRATAGWRGDGPAHRLSDPPSPMPARVALLHGHDERQVVVGVSGAAPVDAEATYPAAYLANLVLGGYFGARLFARLREDRGYVYRVSSNLMQRAGTGMVTVRFATDPHRVGDAMAATHRELVGITGDAAPHDAEIEAARGYAIGSRTVAVADQAGLADALAALAIRGHRLDRLVAWPEALAAVPADAVRAAAAMFRPDRMTGVVLGPIHMLDGVPSPLGGRLISHTDTGGQS